MKNIEKLCPYDGMSLRIYDPISLKYILDNPSQFKIEVKASLSDGYPLCYKAVFVNFFIEFDSAYSNHYILKGSFAKYYFNKKRSLSFTYRNFHGMVAEVSTALKFCPSKAEVYALEFGFNIEIPSSWDCQATCLVNNIAYLSRKPAGGKKRSSELPKKGAIFERFHDQHTLKIYDKTYLDMVADFSDFMRLEKKITKGPPLNKLGIFTLTDLLTKDFTAVLKKSFFLSFKRLIIYQPEVEINDNISKDDRLFLAIYKSDNSWQRVAKNRSELAKAQKKFHDLVSKYTTINKAQYILEQLEKAWDS